MRPLPTSPESPEEPRKPAAAEARTLDLKPTAANQRRGTPVQRAYPWLLAASTLLAAVFCALYISKPVIQTGPAAAEESTAETPAEGSAETPASPAETDTSSASPTDDRLPGDKRPEAVEPRQLAAGDADRFEETNLRIQHVLGATGPAGEDLGRISLDVPVLYESGRVRWTREDVAKARSLLVRIDNYQQKSRALRDEAVQLISEWDELTLRSIPDAALRADSPTLPENQGIGSAGTGPLKSTEAIEINNR